MDGFKINSGWREIQFSSMSMSRGLFLYDPKDLALSLDPAHKPRGIGVRLL